jgi:site-specific recombinase XerD
VSRSTHAEEGESLPYNHRLHQFLTCLKHERGCAEATIVNRARSLKPFLGWLVAQDVPLSTMSPGVITKYFAGILAGRWKRTTVSFQVQSLRSFFRYASSRGWCAAGIASHLHGDESGLFLASATFTPRESTQRSPLREHRDYHKCRKAMAPLVTPSLPITTMALVLRM